MKDQELVKALREHAAWSVHIGIGDRSDIAVTHWMPLPEPPEEGM